MADNKYGFSDDNPFSPGGGSPSKFVWAAGVVLLAMVAAWIWSVYSNSDSDQSIGAHVAVVLIIGGPIWLILFGAVIGGWRAVRKIRRRP